jgi:phospholipid/cholesterol/gamma-HCH transport system substrate-binding protein
VSRKVISAIAGIVLVGLGVAAAFIFVARGADHEPMTVTAQFEDSVGLYNGSAVSVLGMRVGEVVKIVPKDAYVEVTMKIDRGTAIPTNAQAVTVNTSLLTDRHVELTPPYRGGPKMRNGDFVTLAHTRTPVEFDRTLAEIDRLSRSLSGNAQGGGPLADLIAVGDAATAGRGRDIKASLDKLSQALRLGNDNGAHTAGDIRAIVNNLNELTQAAVDNDGAIREFGSNLRQVSDILAAEQIGTGQTGKNLNDVLAHAASILEQNRDKLKGMIADTQSFTTTLVDDQRQVAEVFDLLPMTVDNAYNAIDANAGSLRGNLLFDKAIMDSTFTKTFCNLINRKQLGCGTGTAQDFSPDFGLQAMFDLMGVEHP